jgi:4'-phosphopantetheinyl transferase
VIEPLVLVWLQTIADVPAHDEWLDDDEQETLARLRVAKRRADWRLGRWTAKGALAAFAEDDGPWSIRADPDGAPRAYLRGARAPFVISISHSAGRGACAVARDEPASSVLLGCDIEAVEERSTDFLDLFFTDRERARIHAAADARVRLATLAWSAKESALKALREGLRADTRSVEIELDGPPEGSAGRVRALVAGGRVLCGHWCAVDEAVLTCVAAPACEPIWVPAPASVEGV